MRGPDTPEELHERVTRVSKKFPVGKYLFRNSGVYVLGSSPDGLVWRPFEGPELDRRDIFAIMEAMNPGAEVAYMRLDVTEVQVDSHDNIPVVHKQLLEVFTAHV